MKAYKKNLIVALVCFLIVLVLNFFLPRLLPGNPIAYLTGFSEEDMTPAQVSFYRQALHLNKPGFVQFGYYLRSILDGSLGYSYKKESTVSALILHRLGYTLQITLPAVLLSTTIGLLWGMYSGYRKGSLFDKLSTVFQIVVNTMPTFLIALIFMILFCFRQRWFPYAGLNSAEVTPGTAAYWVNRVHHLILPVLTLTIRETFGTAIVLVTHNPGVIGAMADNVLVLENGRCVEYGKTREVLANPRADYTKALLAAVPKLRR